MSIRDIIEVVVLGASILWLIYSAAFAAGRGWKHGRGNPTATDIHLHGRDWKEVIDNE